MRENEGGEQTGNGVKIREERQRWWGKRKNSKGENGRGRKKGLENDGRWVAADPKKEQKAAAMRFPILVFWEREGTGFQVGFGLPFLFCFTSKDIKLN